MSSYPPQITTYDKAIKVTVDGPREARSKTSRFKNHCTQEKYVCGMPGLEVRNVLSCFTQSKMLKIKIFLALKL